MDLPEERVDWRIIERDSEYWSVVENVHMFVAYSTQAADAGRCVEIHYEDYEETEAREWLTQEAVRDRQALRSCLGCGHAIHVKSQHAPYCGVGCRDHIPQ